MTLPESWEILWPLFLARIRSSPPTRPVSQPLRVVDGECDVIPGATNGAILADAAPWAEYLLVPGGDHLCWATPVGPGFPAPPTGWLPTSWCLPDVQRGKAR